MIQRVKLSSVTVGDELVGEIGKGLLVLLGVAISDITDDAKYLADKILTSRSSIEGERKLVTVLFADVANYTSISEKLDPEEVHQIMDGSFKILMDEIHEHEGTINQYTGGGVMALFGAAIAHEDHARRACYAALRIRDSMRRFAEELRGEHGIEFALERYGVFDRLRKKGFDDLVLDSLPDLPHGQTFLNFTASHDGIGVMGARGILSEEEILGMCDRVREHGGFVSMKTDSDGAQSPYELNITWFSALNRRDAGESGSDREHGHRPVRRLPHQGEPHQRLWRYRQCRQRGALP